MSEVGHVLNCSVALAYGKKIVPGNNIDNHLIIRKSLVKILANRENTQCNAVVPIPNAGIYLGKCWAELTGLYLWNSFSRHNLNTSMFLLSDQLKRERAAEYKLGKIFTKKGFSSVILIDEAITSGISMYRAIKTLREIGVRNIHARTVLPPILPQLCYENVIKYKAGNGLEKDWINRPNDYELIAWCIGANDFSTLDVEDVKTVCGTVCVTCINY
ncbi:hypothetical protein JT05_05090 [Desulfosporosinus sp. Tol-M]|jgi:Glutamine phosphoribosylpyrophosphate amidotransferase|nr:hypothetical protein JT05_05090 [Desulfosporosinus sp. Tol-M]